MFKFASLFLVMVVLFVVSTIATATPYNGPAVLIHKSMVGVQNRDGIVSHSFTQKFGTMAACNNAKADLDAATFPIVSWVAQSGVSNITICAPFDQ